MTEPRRYVNVEFLGGPLDGEVRVYFHPLPEEFRIPLTPPPRAEPTELTATSAARVGCYVASGNQDYETLAVPQAILTTQGRTEAETLVILMRGRKPMQYLWQGEQ